MVGIDQLHVKSTKSQIKKAISYEKKIFAKQLRQIDDILSNLPSVRRYYIQQLIKRNFFFISGGMRSGIEAFHDIKIRLGYMV